MIRFKLVPLFLVAGVAGCEPPSPRPTIDQCLRAQLFRACLASVPLGPQTTVHNDWAEVIQQCERTTHMQSYRLPQFVKPECLGERQ